MTDSLIFALFNCFFKGQGNWRSEPFQKEFQAGDITINIRNVGKRHSENGRIVLVWEGLSEWPDKTTGELMTIHEKGWSIIQPFPDSKKTQQQQQQQSSSSLPLSLMQPYMYMTPGPTTGDGAKRKPNSWAAYHAIFSDIVKPLYETQFAARIQDLENALLDDSLNRRLLAS